MHLYLNQNPTIPTVLQEYYLGAFSRSVGTFASKFPFFVGTVRMREGWAQAPQGTSRHSHGDTRVFVGSLFKVSRDPRPRMDWTDASF